MPGLMRSRGISRITLPSHCTNLNGGTSLGNLDRRIFREHVLQETDPAFADAGLAVGQARDVAADRAGERAEHGFGIRQRNAADEMHDWRFGLLGVHDVGPPRPGQRFGKIIAARGAAVTPRVDRNRPACMGFDPPPKTQGRAMPTSFRQIIDKAVKDKRFLVVPGAHDALSARLIQKIGFETYFIGGFPAVGARYGVPDVGLKGFGEISAAVRDIMSACDLPVFVDGDDGYGDVKNVVHTVQTYERMGVSAILIEDQQWPKRCGHMVGKKVVPIELAEAKIKAAASERINPETWILGRTDARAVYDLDEAMRRAERYIRAGADGIFIEAPRSIAELEKIGKAFDVPQICNPLMGGHTPILSMEELGQLGFNCAVLGLDTIMHAAKAIEAVLVDMKSGKFAHRNDGMDFEDYKKLVGYDKWESIDERFAPKQ